MSDIRTQFSGGVIKTEYSDIGDVLSYVPRYNIGGGGVGRFPS